MAECRRVSTCGIFGAGIFETNVREVGQVLGATCQKINLKCKKSGEFSDFNEKYFEELK